MNGKGSFWAIMERNHDCIYRKMSSKYLLRYLNEFAARLNVCNADTIKQVESVLTRIACEHLPYEDLKADYGPSSGVRS